MGADGGIAWFKLKNPSQERHDRIKKLLSWFDFQNLGNGVHWDNREEFLNKEENSFLWGHEYIYGYEGSYVYGATFEELADFVEAVLTGEVQKELGYSKHESSVSFEDIFLEKDTRPEWVYGYSYWCDKIIKWFNEGYPTEEERKEFLSINIVEWAKEVKSILDFSTYCYEETWT